MAKENTLQGPDLKITLINKKYYILVNERQSSEFLREIKRFAKRFSKLNLDDEHGSEEMTEAEFPGRELYDDDFRLSIPIDQITLSIFFLEAFHLIQCALHNCIAPDNIPQSRRSTN